MSKFSGGFSRMKIGTKILIICLVLVTVPTVLLGLVAYNNSSAAISEQVDILLTTQISDVDKMTANTYDLAQQKLNGDLSVLRQTFYGYGTPGISDGKLVLSGGTRGTYVINDNNELVDQIERMTGSKATIFQKMNGQAIRVSTNVIGADGKRALGTSVSDAVYDTVIRRGETFYGTADVVGKTYITAYEPIKSASGEIIGILFVGVPEDTTYGALKKEVNSIKLGDSGYVYIMDSKGTLISHPTLQGQNLGSEDFVKAMIANKEGVVDKPAKMTYIWDGKEAVAYYMYFPPLDWIVASRVNPADFTRPIDDIRNAIIIILIASIAIGALVSILFGRSIARRMGDLVNLGNQVMEGEINAAARVLENESAIQAGGDEISEVTKAFGGVVKTIQQFSDEVATVSVAATDGRLDIRGDTSKLKGDYANLINGLNETLDAVIGPLNMAAMYIERIGRGDIPEKITASYQGDFNKIKDSLNQCIENINSLVAESNMLSIAAVEGKLEKRGNADKFKNRYWEIIAGINKTLDNVVRPLNEGMRISDEFAQGNFRARFNDEIKVHGDFKKFRDSLNNIGIQVSKALELVNQQIAELGASAEEANASIEEVSAGSAQVAKNSAAVSGNAEQSSHGINEVLKAMEDLSKTIQQVATKAEAVSTLVQESNDYSRKGIDLARKTENGMNGITKSSNEVNAIILEIKAQMDRIGEIVNLITDLANQTNLLALNAAIEAARAGDAGRGFAVVATEVKSLAEESRTSAEKIAEMIGNLQKQTQTAAETVAVSNAEVREGSDALKETLENFNKIVESIDQISRNVTEVAAASEEQAASVEEVTASINEVNDLVSNTAKEATDAAAVSEETAAAIDQITKVIANVNNIVVKVSNEVSKFKI
ncbi:MAG: Sensory rhodopsin II transducer [Methanoregulaceae archaeon PtaB.Bin056]|nr:MAG: Sensory rhodopsin II transducer [Methanoregulaceae archaeon PtaB.Bin056]